MVSISLGEDQEIRTEDEYLIRVDWFASPALCPYVILPRRMQIFTHTRISVIDKRD